MKVVKFLMSLRRCERERRMDLWEVLGKCLERRRERERSAGRARMWSGRSQLDGGFLLGQSRIQ
jgi:hypothetical protein